MKIVFYTVAFSLLLAVALAWDEAYKLEDELTYDDEFYENFLAAKDDLMTIEKRRLRNRGRMSHFNILFLLVKLSGLASRRSKILSVAAVPFTQ